MTKTDPFATSRYDVRAVTMEVNGLKAILNMPKAREKQKDSQGNEVAQGLPEYNQRPAFEVDKYLACPDNWMHGNGKASSYFVPIMPDHGMWLDFTMNVYHEYDVAIVPSIQGINPLTGMKSDPIRLEQYKEMCPKHQREFKQDLFCEDCKFKWHPQNYLSSNNGSPFWIDGFRTEDGTIRQWYFTEEECKGIAAQIIGDERVFAIGLAFYLSKQPKPKPKYEYVPAAYTNIYYGCTGLTGSTGSFGVTGVDAAQVESTWTCNASPSASQHPSWKGFGTSYQPKKSSRRTRGGPRGSSLGARNLASNTPSVDPAFIGAVQAEVASTQKMLEIGAGAKISQRINRDPHNLDYWQEEPAGFIYINYCDIETAQKILDAGTREELEEGFLSGLNTK